MSTVSLNKNNFNNEVMQSDTPVLVDFYADWCGPCKFLAPVIDDLAKEYQGKIKICKLNVDEARSLTLQFNIMGIPTLILFKNKRETERIVGGVTKQRIIDTLNKNTALV